MSLSHFKNIKSYNPFYKEPERYTDDRNLFIVSARLGKNYVSIVEDYVKSIVIFDKYLVLTLQKYENFDPHLQDTMDIEFKELDRYGKITPYGWNLFVNCKLLDKSENKYDYGFDSNNPKEITYIFQYGENILNNSEKINEEMI